MTRAPSSTPRTGTTHSHRTVGASSSGSAQVDESEYGDLAPRGSAAPEQLPSEKKQLGLRDKEWNDDRTTQRATKINRKFITMPWYTWSCIPLDVKRQMWERFQGFYTWDPALDAQMQEIWEKRCLKNYNDNLSAARSRAAGLSNRAGHPYDPDDPRRDMNLLKPYHPDWLSPAIWIAMIDHWNNDHWKAVSVVGRKNRKTEVDGEMSKHTNGSRSFGAQGALMTKANNGVPPSCLELFNQTHKKRSSSGSTSSDTGEYVTSRCSRVADEYATSLSQKYGDDPTNHPLFDKELWEQAVGGMKKGRLFGFGYNNDIDGVLTGTSTHGGASSSSKEIEVLKTQVQELIDRDRLREAEEEKRKKQYEEMAALVAKMSQSQQFSTQTPQPPPDIL